MLRIVRRLCCALALAVLAALPAAAQGVALPSAPADYSNLRAGTFRWMPDARRTGRIEIVVTLPLQRAYVYRGGTLIGVTSISSGRRGHETPTGSYRVIEKARDHQSNQYSNAPMPFMQRLTWDGIALHGGTVTGRPASHGCVRLPLAFARALFGVTALGARVHIIDAEIEADTGAFYLDEPPPLETIGTD